MRVIYCINKNVFNNTIYILTRTKDEEDNIFFTHTHHKKLIFFSLQSYAFIGIITKTKSFIF
jgi:hypothetical protein